MNAVLFSPDVWACNHGNIFAVACELVHRGTRYVKVDVDDDESLMRAARQSCVQRVVSVYVQATA